jgi:hypothetical protein
MMLKQKFCFVKNLGQDPDPNSVNPDPKQFFKCLLDAQQTHFSISVDPSHRLHLLRCMIQPEISIKYIK